MLKLKGIRDGATFAAADAPRELAGTRARSRRPRERRVPAHAPHRRRHCGKFDGERGAFRPCAGKRGAGVEIGDDASWSYLLPAKLAAGRYGLLVIATDTAGNRTSVKVTFTVEAAG